MRNKSMRERFRQYLQKNPVPPLWKHAHPDGLPEFWRQFIDGRQQADAEFVAAFAREMKDRFGIDVALPHVTALNDKLTSHAAENPDFADFISQWSTFKYIAAKPQAKAVVNYHEAFRITNAWLSFENKGKNYLLSMVRAKKLLKHLEDKKINKAIIAEVHRQSVKDLLGEILASAREGYRRPTNSCHYSLLSGYNTSETGLMEWLSLAKEQALKGRHYHFDEGMLYYKMEHNKFSCALLSPTEPNKLYEWDEMASLFIARFKKMLPLRRNTGVDESKAFFQGLSEYYDKIEACEDINDDPVDVLYNKILVTVRFIKLALVEHPFPDGNSRVFGMLILPHLLENLGLGDMYFWEDPNVFCMYGDEECIAAIIDGLENAQRIYRGEACALMKNSSTLRTWKTMCMADKRYFFKALQEYPFEAPQKASAVVDAMRKLTEAFSFAGVEEKNIESFSADWSDALNANADSEKLSALRKQYNLFRSTPFQQEVCLLDAQCQQLYEAFHQGHIAPGAYEINRIMLHALSTEAEAWSPVFGSRLLPMIMDYLSREGFYNQIPDFQKKYICRYDIRPFAAQLEYKHALYKKMHENPDLVLSNPPDFMLLLPSAIKTLEDYFSHNTALGMSRGIHFYLTVQRQIEPLLSEACLNAVKAGNIQDAAILNIPEYDKEGFIYQLWPKLPTLNLTAEKPDFMSTFLSLFPDNNAKARFLKRIAGELHLFVKTPEFLVEVLSLLCTDQCLAFLQQTAIRLDTLVHDKETLFRLCALLPSGKKTAILNEASLNLEAFSEDDQEAVIRFCLEEWERPLELALVHRFNPGLWKSFFKLLNLDVNRITPFELQSILAGIPSEQWHRFIQESGLILKAFVIREPRLLHIIFSRLPENSIPDFLIREDIQICRAHYLKQLLQQLSPENQKRFFETNSVNLHSLIETGADLAILAPLLPDEQFNTFLETSQNLGTLISTPSCLIAVLNRLPQETWREFFIKSRLDPELVFSHSYALKDLSRTHPKLWEPFLEQMQPILPFKTLISDATALLAFFEGMSPEAQGIFLKTCGIRLASIINTGDDLFHFLNLLPQSYWNLFFQKAVINIPQLFDNKKKLQHFLNGMTNIDNKSGISIEAIAEKIAEPDKREDTILFLQILLYALPQSNVFFSASGLNPNDLVKTAESLEIISLNWPHGLSTGFLRQIGLNPEIIDAFETIAAKITHSFARWTICERANGYATPWRGW